MLCEEIDEFIMESTGGVVIVCMENAVLAYCVTTRSRCYRSKLVIYRAVMGTTPFVDTITYPSTPIMFEEL